MTALASASARDSAGFAADVITPLLARGVIARRPRVEDALDRVDADRRAIGRMHILRARYGDGPLLVRVPGRTVALVLSASDVRRVLDAAPEPFSPANREKRAALSHFQPHGVLISEGAERAERRAFNESVLDTGAAVHRELGAEISARVEQEAADLVEEARRLKWERFATAWWRAVRRIVLGDSARDDHEITGMLSRLRRDANWAYLKPARSGLRAEFLARVRAYIEGAEPGSLAELAAAHSSPGVFPEDQFAHWLFAFDAGGMASFRALALLDAHAGRIGTDPGALRALVLESLRLWPTTQAVLRDTTEPTTWEQGTLPAGAGVLVFAPFFHRDGERSPHADSFAPELWTHNRAASNSPLIPFSQGPAECPGRDLVLHATSSFLSTIVRGRQPRQAHPRPLRPDRPLPATLSPFRLEFEMTDSG